MELLDKQLELDNDLSENTEDLKILRINNRYDENTKVVHNLTTYNLIKLVKQLKKLERDSHSNKLKKPRKEYDNMSFTKSKIRHEILEEDNEILKKNQEIMSFSVKKTSIPQTDKDIKKLKTLISNETRKLVKSIALAVTILAITVAILSPIGTAAMAAGTTHLFAAGMAVKIAGGIGVGLSLLNSVNCFEIISGYKEQLKSYKKSEHDNKKEINKLEKSIKDVEAEIDKLKKSIESKENEIKEIEAEQSKLEPLIEAENDKIDSIQETINSIETIESAIKDKPEEHPIHEKIGVHILDNDTVKPFKYKPGKGKASGDDK